MNGRLMNKVFLHLGVWLVLFLIPLFLYFESPDVDIRFTWRVCVMLLGLLITFYSNAIWAIDALMYKNRYVLFVLFNICLYFGVASLKERTCRIFDNHKKEARHRHQSSGLKTMFVFNDVEFFLLSVGASVGIRHSGKIQEYEMERKKLENETLTSELSLLHYQMQPHFFFNTLNNIYVLIGKSPADAQKAVVSLSKMMRYVLYESQEQTISLAKEIDFLKNYASLMRIRLGAGSVVDLQFPEVDQDVNIPSLLFIPILENAFKHGNCPGGNAKISCLMTLHPTKISFVVKNAVSPTDKAEDRSHSGIGLGNLRKRLEILFPNGDFLMESDMTDDGVYVAKIEVPISRACNACV